MTKQARAARTSKSDLVARYVIEKSHETEFPGISFRGSLAGREAYLTDHRVAVWEVLAVHEETKSVEKTVSHFRWPRVLVKRALAYAQAFAEESLGRRVLYATPRRTALAFRIQFAPGGLVGRGWARSRAKPGCTPGLNPC